MAGPAVAINNDCSMGGAVMGPKLVETALAVFVWNFYNHWWLSKFKLGELICKTISIRADPR